MIGSVAEVGRCVVDVVEIGGLGLVDVVVVLVVVGSGVLIIVVGLLVVVLVEGSGLVVVVVVGAVASSEPLLMGVSVDVGLAV